MMKSGQRRRGDAALSPLRLHGYELGHVGFFHRLIDPAGGARDPAFFLQKSDRAPDVVGTHVRESRADLLGRNAGALEYRGQDFAGEHPNLDIRFAALFLAGQRLRL
jgi:hypothetical protein